MLFSVVIPIYNGAKTIRRCIESAINQSYKDDYEIVVVENACTDSTCDILSKINDKRLRVIHNDHTVSQFANHNIGLNAAKGDYIVYLHSDDELTPIALSIFAEHIKNRQYPQRYMACGLSMFSDVHENIQNAGLHSGPVPEFNTIFSGASAMRIFTSGALFQPTGTCYSRDALMEIGGFLGLDIACPEDWYLSAWAAYNYFEFEIIDRLLLKREFSSSWGNTYTAQEKCMRWKIVQDGFLAKLNEQQRSFFYLYYNSYKYPLWEIYFHPKKMLFRKVMQRPWGLTRWKNFINALHE